MARRSALVLDPDEVDVRDVLVAIEGSEPCSDMVPLLLASERTFLRDGVVDLDAPRASWSSGASLSGYASDATSSSFGRETVTPSPVAKAPSTSESSSHDATRLPLPFDSPWAPNNDSVGNTINLLGMECARGRGGQALVSQYR